LQLHITNQNNKLSIATKTKLKFHWLRYVVGPFSC